MSAPASPGAWPKKLGVPLNPQVSGAHIVRWTIEGEEPQPAWWDAKARHWLFFGDANPMGAGWVGPQATYHGPCHTAATVAAAAKEARDAALEEAADICDRHAHALALSHDPMMEAGQRAHIRDADAIRARKGEG